MEMLAVFGEIPEDFQEKKKYAKWKCLDIKNALDSGVTPTPGPPGGFEEEEEDLEERVENGLILIFCSNLNFLDFFQIFIFVLFLVKIYIFGQNFYFWSKFRFLVKFSIFGQKF